MKKGKYKSSHYWLSFAYPICEECKNRGEASFVGVIIVPAKTEREVAERLAELRLDSQLQRPGCDLHNISIEAHPLPDDALPSPEYRNRLLSRDDLKELEGRGKLCSCGCGQWVSMHDHVACSSTEAPGPNNRYFWLSFVKPDRPFPFLGIAIVECDDGNPAQTAWALNINPGGEVAFQPISPKDIEVFGPYLNKLITNKNEAERLALLMS